MPAADGLAADVVESGLGDLDPRHLRHRAHHSPGLLAVRVVE
jgi:hypothetical protein